MSYPDTSSLYWRFLLDCVYGLPILIHIVLIIYDSPNGSWASHFRRTDEVLDDVFCTCGMLLACL